ncbi:MAG: copper resistance protein CopC [Caldilineaceae bacterium]|nr:copper resistance protein CopC [Caldilineaceae bacterium]
MQRKRTRHPLGLALLLLVGCSVFWPLSRTLAHADYERAEPAADAILSTPPTQVRMWFTQELFRRQGMNKIEVFDAAGQRVDLDDTTIDDDDRTLLQVSLSPVLSAGLYTVRWQSLSADDGHAGTGEFSFTVGAGTDSTAGAPAVEATATALPTVAPTNTTPPRLAATAGPTATASVIPPTATPSGAFPGLPCLGAAPLLLVVGAVLTQQRRGRRWAWLWGAKPKM